MQFVSLFNDSVIAAADLSASTFVGADQKPAAPGAGVLGVSRSDIGQGELAPVDMLGSAIVKAGAPIPPYTDVEVGADALAVPHADGVVVGRTLRQGATIAGQMVEVFLVPGALVAAAAD